MMRALLVALLLFPRLGIPDRAEPVEPAPRPAYERPAEIEV